MLPPHLDMDMDTSEVEQFFLDRLKKVVSTRAQNSGELDYCISLALKKVREKMEEHRAFDFWIKTLDLSKIKMGVQPYIQKRN